jgi:hypothetical protein
MQYGKRNPNTIAKLNFPGFQEILDFTATGSESSVSVTVDGDTDKEFVIVLAPLGVGIGLRLNNDSTAGKYGYQYLQNSVGSIAAGRGTGTFFYALQPATGTYVAHLLTPSGFIKTSFVRNGQYTTGTTISDFNCIGESFNSTANITSLNFFSGSNWTSGTRITVYARRSNV